MSFDELTSIRSYRQIAGGDIEVAGESEATAVPVDQFAPLTPEGSYEFWLVGVNAEGEGPESNRIQYTVPAPVV